MNWYSFEPADTLFFRGAEPMNIGENHTATANFPPPARTIAGALRTTILKQNKIPIDQYYANNIEKELLNIIGPADQKAGFSVTGPLFELDDIMYVSAPYSWFIDKESGDKETAKVYKSRLLNSGLIKIWSKSLYWTKGEKSELETLGGKWISLSDLYSYKENLSIKETCDFVSDEPRTGIALDKNRSARKHHIYSFIHARLKKNVRILFGVNKDIPIADEGILKLGAEQRFGRYKREVGISIGEGKSGMFLSLSITEGTLDANDAVVATGKIQYLGGWDMRKGFHKPMTGFFPPGSVFNQKLNDNFIEI